MGGRPSLKAAVGASCALAGLKITRQENRDKNNPSFLPAPGLSGADKRRDANHDIVMITTSGSTNRRGERGCSDFGSARLWRCA
jgi:hypothetical protein